MKSWSLFILILMSFSSCKQGSEISSISSVNWDNRSIELPEENMESATSYLSVYSQIYSQTEKRQHNLTATISIKNINRNDTVYIKKAEYFNTKGEPIRTYIKDPIYILPLETVEIIIDEDDKEGGTGANFLFDWLKKINSEDPFFESIMISTSGQQGLSFTSQGIKLNSNDD